MATSQNKICNLNSIQLFVLLIITSSFSGYGYSSKSNYVRTVDPLNGSIQSPSLNPDESLISVEYVNGLGRKVQSVLVGQGGNGEDIIDLQEYDRTG